MTNETRQSTKRIRYTYYQPLGPVGDERGGYMLFPGMDEPQDHRYIPVYEGEVSAPEREPTPQTLERIWSAHNRDDRPRGREIRSMCTGDLCDMGEYGIWIVDTVGWRQLPQSAVPELLPAPPAGLGYPVSPEAVRGPRP